MYIRRDTLLQNEEQIRNYNNFKKKYQFERNEGEKKKYFSCCCFVCPTKK